MFITPAFAQAATGATTGIAGGLSSLTAYLPILAFGVGMYFLFLRPQQAQAKALKSKLAALKRGDKVVTSGGIVGTVKKAAEASSEVDVEIAPNVVVSIVRTSITTVLTPEPANDKT